MNNSYSHRALLSVELEEPDRVECRFLSPEQSEEEIYSHGVFSAASQEICDDYYRDLEYLPEGGIPPQQWLENHREKRRLATEALIQVGLPEPIDRQLCQLRSQIGNDMILLELSTNSPELDCLPWELLGNQDPAKQYSSNLVVWRYISMKRVQAWPQNHILLVSASPPEQRISPNIDKEFSDIHERVECSGRRDVKIRDIMHSSAAQFIAELFQSRPNVLHMAMHGDRKLIYFEREALRQYDQRESSQARKRSRQREIPYDSLAADIADINAVLTIMLSVCYSSNRDRNRASFTRMLIEAGVPSAIGMAYSVTPEVSEEFCQIFYREICKGERVADAYGSAIVTLRELPSYDECLWSVPMLYASDNVIPLPTSDYVRFLDNIKASVNRIEELRKNITRLSVQVGARPGNFSVDSTRAAMGIGKVRNGLRYFRDNLTVARADSYLWKLEFEAAYNEVGHRLTEVGTCMAELSQAGGSAAFSQSCQRFRSVAPSLISELDNIRRLVIDEFPAVSHAALPA